MRGAPAGRAPEAEAGDADLAGGRDSLYRRFDIEASGRMVELLHHLADDDELIGAWFSLS